MSYRGVVKNGVIVLDPPVLLEEGLNVSVEPVQMPTGGAPGTPAALLDVMQRFHWDGPPGELERLQREVDEDREHDLQIMLEREKSMPRLE